MRILFIGQLFPNPRRPTHGVFNLSRAKALQNKNCEVKVISPINLTPHKKYLIPYPCFITLFKYLKDRINIPFKTNFEGVSTYYPKWISLPRGLAKYHYYLMKFFCLKKIKCIIKKFKPDLIITSELNPYSVFTKYIKINFNVTIFSIFEGSDILIRAGKLCSLNRIINIINNNVDIVLFVSEYMENTVINILNYKFLNYRVLNNGYNTELFYHSGKKNWNVNGPISILYIAALLSEVKGIDTMLEAMKSLDKRFKLSIIGDGDKRPKYEKYTKDNKINVEFLGRIEHKNLKNYYNNFDLLCAPSRSESFGIAILEAMACGMPVIASNVGGLKEKIINGFNGYLINPDSPKELAESIIRAINSSWDFCAIAEWAKSNYSWEKWANEIINEYNNMN